MWHTVIMAMVVVLTSCADDLEADLAKYRAKAMEADGSLQMSAERLASRLNV
jgi:nitrate/nitrite-specific signal transduction histidine kinase